MAVHAIRYNCGVEKSGAVFSTAATSSSVGSPSGPLTGTRQVARSGGINTLPMGSSRNATPSPGSGIMRSPTSGRMIHSPLDSSPARGVFHNAASVCSTSTLAGFSSNA